MEVSLLFPRPLWGRGDEKPTPVSLEGEGLEGGLVLMDTIQRHADGAFFPALQSGPPDHLVGVG
jgi:hypothetical protein